MWLGQDISWNKGQFFRCRMYFWDGWVDAKCSAVMYMFDVNEDKILVLHKPRKGLIHILTSPVPFLWNSCQGKVHCCTDTLKINPTLLHYVNIWVFCHRTDYSIHQATKCGTNEKLSSNEIVWWGMAGNIFVTL